VITHMRKILAPVAVAGLTASALAIAGPITAHAAGTSGGPCSGAGTGSPVQHTGPGHHSFTDSDNNCVNFVGTGNTAFLNDSDNKLINMFGNNDIVRDFNNSDNNSIAFAAGANFDELNASNATFNTLTFTTGAVGDVVDLQGITNDSILISGTGVFADVVGSNASCTITSSTAGNGTAGHPGTVIC